MNFIDNISDRKHQKLLKDVAQNVRLDAIIREEHKMEAKMKGRAGINQRLEDEGQHAETMRRKKEKEERDAREFQWAQQEKLAVELENIKREEFVDLKLRQQLRETSLELRELESQLKLAYTNKDLAAQLEEKKLAKLQEKLEVQRERKILAEIDESEKAYLAKIQKEEHLKKLQYQKELREQVKQVDEEPYQQFLRDKQMMDDIVRLIHEENMREQEMKMIAMKKTKEEMDQFWRAREVWRERERKATEEEDRRLVEYLTLKDAEAERRACEEKRKKEDAEKRQQIVLDNFVKFQKKDEDLQKALEALYMEEMKTEASKQARAEMEALIRRKVEAQLQYEEQHREKVKRLAYERQVNEQLREELLKKFAEDERVEQATKERRRQMMLDHKKAMEDIVVERNRIRNEEELAFRELERMEEERMKIKHKMIEEERMYMLQEHAKNLVGYLPKGLLKPTDFPHIGPEFGEKKTSIQC